MEKETIYCGNGKEVTFNDGNSIVNFSVALDKIREHIYDFDGKKYVNLTLCKNKEGVNEYGKSHYVKINDFKPEPQAEKKETAKSDLPF